MKLFFSILFFSSSILAFTPKTEHWGVGFGQRTASIPYNSSKRSVSDMIPQFYYKSGNFEIDGLYAHYRFLNFNKLSFALATEYRFFDTAKNLQNEIQKSGFDYGLETIYRHSTFWTSRAQLLLDKSTRPYIKLQTENDLLWKRINYKPYVYLNVRSKEFNDEYYGQNQLGYEVGAGVNSSIHVAKNFSIHARVKVSALDPKTSDSPVIDNSLNTETFFGIAFTDDTEYQRPKPSSSKLKSRPFIRVAYTQATPSNLSEITNFHTAWDKYNNDMIALSYGIPVSDTFFGTKTSVYLTPTYVQHLKSSVQDNLSEFAFALKVFIPIHWPIDWRIGLSEGLSYMNKLSYIEKAEIDAKGYKESKLLNYIDLSIDVSLDKLGMKGVWAGLDIHHRSAIFESSSMFGRIKGGSNYIGLAITQEI